MCLILHTCFSFLFIVCASCQMSVIFQSCSYHYHQYQHHHCCCCLCYCLSCLLIHLRLLLFTLLFIFLFTKCFTITAFSVVETYICAYVSGHSAQCLRPFRTSFLSLLTLLILAA